MNERFKSEASDYLSFDNQVKIIAAGFIRVRLTETQAQTETEIKIREHNMTPNEELFKKFFGEAKELVKDMSDLKLSAFIEELEETAFKAKAYIYSALDEDKERKKKRNGSKSQGFETSLTVDDATSEAIKTIKERQKKLSKADRIQEELKKLYALSGSPDAESESARIMSARNMLKQVETVKNTDKTDLNEPRESKPVFNPFEKKS